MKKIMAFTALFLTSACTSQAHEIYYHQRPVAEQLRYCEQPKPEDGVIAVWYERNEHGECVAKAQGGGW